MRRSTSDHRRPSARRGWVLTPYRSDREERQIYAQIESLRAEGVSAQEAIGRVADANDRGIWGVRRIYYKWRKVLGPKSGGAP